MSPAADVRVLPVDSWAAAVADAWTERLQANPRLRMCLPTGSTPLPLYERMVERPVSWARAEVLLLDEWVGVPPDEPGRCDTTLRRTLLDHVDIAAGGYRSIDADAVDLAAECAAVDAWLDGGLDLAILGVGTNGHVGMNEPGSALSERTHEVELAPATVQSAVRYFGDRARPTHGVTVGLRDLLRAEHVWVIVTGGQKARTVRDCVIGPVQLEVPGSLLRNHPRCVWWLDEAAAGGLPGM